MPDMEAVNRIFARYDVRLAWPA